MRYTSFLTSMLTCVLVMISGIQFSYSESLNAPKYDIQSVIEARLLIMIEVAKYKHVRSVAIEDVAREQKVIASFKTLAGAEGVEASKAERLIKSQITAAKMVQTDLIDMWGRKGMRFDHVLDLSREIRPRIDAVNKNMIGSFIRFCESTDQQKGDIVELLSVVPASMQAHAASWKMASAGIDKDRC